MSLSEELSRSFYARLGASGLARRTDAERDEGIVQALIEMLSRHLRVLDVGCGYGRTAIPLARHGHTVHGVDLSPNLIEAGVEAAVASRLDVRFVIGSMTRLPYPPGSFDAAICLWSAFHELLDEGEQHDAVSEMWRVLRPGGVALIEGPAHREPEAGKVSTGEGGVPADRIDWTLVEGMINPHFRHDEVSLRRLCIAAGVTEFEIFERDWGGRRRLLLRLDRP